jgi:hypothetical protein
LFKLEKPVIMTADEFDTYWPLVSTVYMKIGGVLTQQRGDVLVQKYECQLRKSKKGGKAPPAREGVKKKYSATIRQPGLCQVRMKITRTVAAPVTVTIERLDSEEHPSRLGKEQRDCAINLSSSAGYGGSGKGICSCTGYECFERSWNPTGKRASERCRWTALGTVSTNYVNKQRKLNIN